MKSSNDQNTIPYCAKCISHTTFQAVHVRKGGRPIAIWDLPNTANDLVINSQESSEIVLICNRCGTQMTTKNHLAALARKQATASRAKAEAAEFARIHREKSKNLHNPIIFGPLIFLEAICLFLAYNFLVDAEDHDGYSMYLYSVALFMLAPFLVYIACKIKMKP